MPVFLLHSKTYPFVLVVEVLLAIVIPNPALLLYVTKYNVDLATRSNRMALGSQSNEKMLTRSSQET